MATGCSGPMAEVSVLNSTDRPIAARVVAQIGDGVDLPQPIDPATGEPRPVPLNQARRVVWEFEIPAGRRVTQGHEFMGTELSPEPTLEVELQSTGGNAWAATLRGPSPMRVEARTIDGQLRLDPQRWMDRNYEVEWRGR